MTRIDPPDPLLRPLCEGERFIITSHLNPDGDAVGSSLGLARLLRRFGKVAQVWLHDPVPSMFAQLAGSDRVHTGSDPPSGFPGNFDAAIALECPSLSRSGLDKALGEIDVLNIDHHLGNESYGLANWADSSAPALGEMILTLAEKLKIPLDPKTATCLLVALVSDTGGFRFSNSSDRAFTAAAELVRRGAQPQQISQWLYESRSEASLRLLQEMLGSLEVHEHGRVATALLTREMFERSGAAREDTEGMVDFPRSIASVEAVGLIREIDGNRVKVSLRSKDRVNVEEIARRNGGGGHRNAAGFRLDASAAAARQTVIDELIQALEKHDSQRPSAD
ncbi:MAG: bifunctional oligoribonuclease/PAP phosphatase NrnA [bacterium]|nr:bifunctional oligoribonuclease/PAP phosphatase NrnA [bacterium]